MNDNFATLEQGGFTLFNKYGFVIAMMLIIIGVGILRFSDISPVPQYFTTTNETMLAGGRTQLYFFDSTPIVRDYRHEYWQSFWAINWHPLGLPLASGGMLLIIIGVILLAQSNPNLNRYINIIYRNLFARHKITETLNIHSAPSGFMCARAFTINKQGFLRSIGVGRAVWPQTKVESSVVPACDNTSGIYAFRLGAFLDNYGISPFQAKAWGIVVLSGKCIGHANGFVRSQYATIVVLITQHQKVADKLKEHYSCPVLISSNPTRTIGNWTISEQGIFWLQQNTRLLDEAKYDLDVIEHLKAYQEFEVKS